MIYVPSLRNGTDPVTVEAMVSRKDPPAKPPAEDSEKPIRLTDLIPRQTVFGGRKSGQSRGPGDKGKDRSR